MRTEDIHVVNITEMINLEINRVLITWRGCEFTWRGDEWDPPYSLVMGTRDCQKVVVTVEQNFEIIITCANRRLDFATQAPTP